MTDYLGKSLIYDGGVRENTQEEKSFFAIVLKTKPEIMASIDPMLEDLLFMILEKKCKIVHVLHSVLWLGV